VIDMGMDRPVVQCGNGCVGFPPLEGEARHLCFQEDTRMNIGEPVRELEVEPLLAPAVMPEAPTEPSVAPRPDLEPVEVPD
jgi:hypothetical protein